MKKRVVLYPDTNTSIGINDVLREAKKEFRKMITEGNYRVMIIMPFNYMECGVWIDNHFSGRRNQDAARIILEHPYKKKNR